MWDVILRAGNQLRVGNHGAILGFDVEALAAIALALGYDTNALFELFHYAEHGMHQAIKDHGNQHHEKCIDPSGGDRGG